MCHNVWPGRAVQDGLPRSANVRAASMYQASEVEHLLLAIMGYPRASGTRYRTDLEGPLWHPVSWLRRADRSSISSFHLADSAGKLFELIILVSEPLRQRSRIVSHCMRRDPRLIFPTARENSPSDAGELVGERDCQHVAVEPLRFLLDPRP